MFDKYVYLPSPRWGGGAGTPWYPRVVAEIVWQLGLFQWGGGGVKQLTADLQRIWNLAFDLRQCFFLSFFLFLLFPLVTFSFWPPPALQQQIDWRTDSTIYTDICGRPLQRRRGAWHGVVLLASLHEKRFVYQPKTSWKKRKKYKTKTQRVNKVTVKTATTTTAKRRRITFWAAHWTHLWHAHHIRHVCVWVCVCVRDSHIRAAKTSNKLSTGNTKIVKMAHTVIVVAVVLVLLSLSQASRPLSPSLHCCWRLRRCWRQEIMQTFQQQHKNKTSNKFDALWKKEICKMTFLPLRGKWRPAFLMWNVASNTIANGCWRGNEERGQRGTLQASRRACGHASMTFSAIELNYVQNWLACKKRAERKREMLTKLIKKER